MKREHLQRLLIFGIIFLLIGGIILADILLNSNHKVPENPPETVGNSAGNLYNGGLFCEASDGTVYFSNPYDNGSLYAMDAGQENLHKVATGAISHINTAGDYLYYYSSSNGGESGLGYIRKNRGIYRCKTDGSEIYSLADTISDGLILVGDTIYYTDYSSGEDGNALIFVLTCNTNGDNASTAFQEPVVLGCALDGILYYAGMKNDHYLYSYQEGIGSRLLDDNTYMYLPVISQGYVYYIDLYDDYHLKKCPLGSDEVTTLVNERVDTYNLYGSVIYYQNAVADAYALKRIYTDGTNDEIVRSGVYHNLQIADGNVYFQSFQSEFPIYTTPVEGPVNVTTFEKAQEAVSIK